MPRRVGLQCTPQVDHVHGKDNVSLPQQVLAAFGCLEWMVRREIEARPQVYNGRIQPFCQRAQPINPGQGSSNGVCEYDWPPTLRQPERRCLQAVRIGLDWRLLDPALQISWNRNAARDRIFLK